MINSTEVYTIENIVDEETLALVETENGQNLSLPSILVSKEGVIRLGFDADTYNVVNIRLNSKANPLVFDAKISKMAQGQSLKNQ